MSVIVMGMEMPENCHDCTFNIYPTQMRTVEAEGSET